MPSRALPHPARPYQGLPGPAQPHPHRALPRRARPSPAVPCLAAPRRTQSSTARLQRVIIACELSIDKGIYAKRG
jgi:hypothetical protein